MIESLVYISSAVKQFTKDDIAGLLTVSRKNNEKHGLSGVLLYADGGFIQVLEGEKHQLDLTYRKTLCDPRHQNILELYREVTSEPVFRKWKMACQKIALPENAVDIFQLNHHNISKLELQNIRSEVFMLIQSFLKVHTPHMVA